LTTKNKFLLLKYRQPMTFSLSLSLSLSLILFFDDVFFSFLN